MYLGAVSKQSQTVCQGVGDLVWLAKDTLRRVDAIKVWTGTKGDDDMSELATGQVWIPEIAHHIQGT